jgi:hypothetical protein
LKQGRVSSIMRTTFILPFALLALFLAMPARYGERDRFLRALVVFAGTLLSITELLSLFQALQRGPLFVSWGAVAGVALAYALIKGRALRVAIPIHRFDPVVLVCVAGSGGILALTAIAAVFSPPNSADTLAYHMPRVVYWAEAGSVRFFPTQYFNQIMLQPLAEYFMLHTYVLSGGDHAVNLVQWFASLGCIAGASAVAKEFGSEARGQGIAALFCATIPSGILASSGAKNDYVLAMWLITAVYFALRFARRFEPADAIFLGGALGLALLTKGTAYVFAPWPLAAIWARPAFKHPRRMAAGAGIALGCALLINAPHYVRNYRLSGSVMGFDSAFGDGLFRWRNETFGWKQTASNILRNVSEQLGDRSARWNRAVYDFVVSADRELGIDPNDPATTWRWSVYAPPQNANHEANGASRWHLAILCILGCVLGIRALGRRDRERALYAASLLCAFVAFCAYLKWQPYLARLFLPLFALGAPLAASVGDWRRVALGRRAISPVWIQLAFCLFLLDCARHAALQNWVRPLKGPDSVLKTPREVQYFSDMKQWPEEKEYYGAAVDLIAKSGCETVGIDITNFQLEYPLEALLREIRPRVRFVHTGVENVSARYAQPVNGPVCAVVCFNCAGDERRLGLYKGFGVRTVDGKFVLMFR